MTTELSDTSGRQPCPQEPSALKGKDELVSKVKAKYGLKKQALRNIQAVKLVSCVKIRPARWQPLIRRVATPSMETIGLHHGSEAEHPGDREGENQIIGLLDRHPASAVDLPLRIRNALWNADNLRLAEAREKAAALHDQTTATLFGKLASAGDAQIWFLRPPLRLNDKLQPGKVSRDVQKRRRIG